VVLFSLLPSHCRYFIPCQWTKPVTTVKGAEGSCSCCSHFIRAMNVTYFDYLCCLPPCTLQLLQCRPFNNHGLPYRKANSKLNLTNNGVSTINTNAPTCDVQTYTMSVYDGFTCTDIWTVMCGFGVWFQPTENVFVLDVGVFTTSCAWPDITLATVANTEVEPLLDILLKVAY